MEPPAEMWASLWSFIRFLPFFLGLLLLGILKGAILCPLICVIMTAGNSGVILGLWPAHAIWTYYSVARSKLLGPVLKIVSCIGATIFLALWPLAGVAGSVVGGAGYGFLSPLMATFKAVEERSNDKFRHCITDGTWETVQGSFTVVRDLWDVCFHSFFSIMEDVRLRSPPDGERYEISIIYLMGSIVIGLGGIVVDFFGISLTALFKCPYMLFKGWQRLFQDLIGREGPFLETACVPFAGLAIILWPAAVVGALMASVLSSLLLGGYAAVVTYQERSVRLGMRYIIASLALYDEYSNDILDLPEGSCFPRLWYRRGPPPSHSLSRRSSFMAPPSRSVSFKNSVLELNPLKLMEHLFAECERYGESLIAEGLITAADVEESLRRRGGGSGSGSGGSGGGTVRVGLPAYAILQALLRSGRANADGIVLSDNTEITTTNKPKDAFFDWFFEPLLIMKQQICAENLSDDEEAYLCRLVLLAGDPLRVKELNAIYSAATAERRRAELEAIARRLQGITKSVSRYPTYRRQFDVLLRSLTEKLEGRIRSAPRARTGSRLARFFSMPSHNSLHFIENGV